MGARVPRSLARFIDRCLIKDRDQRFADTNAAYEAMHPAFAMDQEMVDRVRAATEADIDDTISQSLEGIEVAEGFEGARVVAEGRPADVIVSHAGDAQLIVVGTHGKGMVRRVLLGSVSRQVLNDADRPVAVVDLPGA